MAASSLWLCIPLLLTSLGALLVHDPVAALPALDRILRLDQVVGPAVYRATIDRSKGRRAEGGGGDGKGGVEL